MVRAWDYREAVLRATTLSDRNETRYHLTVEAMSHLGEWEWVVWRGGDLDPVVRHGIAQTANAAMAAAEGAAEDLMINMKPLRQLESLLE